tara:strand:+ start:237 stop:1046 length:810 start_codon:yes stop_codon:yes gene_type:complete
MASTLKEQGYKKALVTGTSSGIGLALAKALIAEGLHVVGVSRRAASINSDRYTHLSIDLLNETDLKTLQAHTQGDPPQIWISNAGQGLIGDAWCPSAEEIESNRKLLYDVPVQLTRHFKEILPKASICAVAPYLVQVSSLAVELPIPNMPYYNAAKSALSAFSQSLLLDKDLPFKLIDLRPGDFDTGFMEAESIKESPISGSSTHKKFIDQHKKAPKPELAARCLVQSLRSQRSGIVRCGGFFQSRIAPLGTRLLPSKLLHSLIRAYFK